MAGGTGVARQPSTNPAASVLLVEDDPRIRSALTLSLTDEGYTVTSAANGEKALDALGPDQPTVDVILLDLMLPGIDGLTLCRMIRHERDVPIIIVSARTDTSDVIAGLEAGADDYVTKPLEASELNARIRALLRRVRSAGPPALYEIAGLSIEPDRGAVYRDGEQLPLTKTEFRLLCELAAAGGHVVTREILLERVWGYGYFGDTRLLDVHIMRLRRKVEPDPGNPSVILTTRGVGFRLATPQ